MLLTVSLCPDAVHFDVAGRLEKFVINDSVSVFDIKHQYGKLVIEARDQTLSLSWGPSEDPPPHNSLTVNYFRATDSLYYPEVLIEIPGYVQISRRAI